MFSVDGRNWDCKKWGHNTVNLDVDGVSYSVLDDDGVWKILINCDIFTGIFFYVCSGCSDFGQTWNLVNVDTNLRDFRIIVHIFVVPFLQVPDFILESSTFS